MKRINKNLIIVVLFLLCFVLFGCEEEIDQTTCKHTFENGVCTICKYHCDHTIMEDDICQICGMSLQDFCNHEWEKGVCEICGKKCEHEHVTHGVCDTCNMNIQNYCHHTFENGVCTRCEYECLHEVLNGGICKICGIDYRTICQHQYVNGVCKICTYVCDHGDTPCGERCSICGAKADHRFVGGKCTMCGFEMKFVSDKIPDQFLNTNCPQKGRVDKVVFQSYDYANNRAYENTFFVYLPYGYDNNNDDYNVLYLTHGSGENAAYWLAQLSYKGGYTEQTKVVLDNLHYYKTCEPTIVVTPTENLNGTANFYKELVNNIMPLAETMYRTKAHLYGKNVNEVKLTDFIPSREYRAYAGLSRGSMIGWGVMAYDLEYFGYFGYYSGGSYGLDTQMNALKKRLADSNDPYDIKFAYHSCGDDDHMYANHKYDYQTAINVSNGRLVDGVNCIFLEKPGFQHRYTAWIIDLYNSLGYAFFKYN